MMKRTLALAALISGLANAAEADTTAMCVDSGGTEAQCSCATEALKNTVRPEDAERYNAVATVFVANRADGLGWVVAWEAAIASVATEAGVGPSTMQAEMNPVGSAHRDAMKACEQS